MSRYRVTTTSSAVFMVDAKDFQEAESVGTAWADGGVRPQYKLETTAEAEYYSEPDPVVKRMRRRIATARVEAEHA